MPCMEMKIMSELINITKNKNKPYDTGIGMIAMLYGNGRRRFYECKRKNNVEL